MSNESKSQFSVTFFNQEVPYQLAETCINEYLKAPNTGLLPRTDYIEFTKDPLNNWMDRLSATTDYKTVRVSLGIYTKEIITHFKADPKLIGRVTVFFMPYNGANAAEITSGVDKLGGKASPYNLGEIHP